MLRDVEFFMFQQWYATFKIGTCHGLLSLVSSVRAIELMY
jgi:hypothetical protein